MPNLSNLTAQDNSYTVDLLRLRDLTFRVGVVHPAQAQQLQIWPRVAIPHSVSSEARVDVRGYRVDFHVKTRGKAPAHMKKRLQGLDESVKFMFGDWWTVRVFEGRKIIFTSPAKKPAPEKKEFLGTDFHAGRIVPEKPWQFQTTKQPPASKPSSP